MATALAVACAAQAKEDMAATQPALGVENTGDTKRLANHARRAINALAARPTVEPELEETSSSKAPVAVASGFHVWPSHFTGFL